MQMLMFTSETLFLFVLPKYLPDFQSDAYRNAIFDINFGLNLNVNFTKSTVQTQQGCYYYASKFRGSSLPCDIDPLRSVSLYSLLIILSIVLKYGFGKVSDSSLPRRVYNKILVNLDLIVIFYFFSEGNQAFMSQLLAIRSLTAIRANFDYIFILAGLLTYNLGLAFSLGSCFVRVKKLADMDRLEQERYFEKHEVLFSYVI